MHKKQQGKSRYVGIKADARRLGVTRQHLYYVLEGKRPSRSLLRRYQALQRGKGGAS